MSLLELSFQEVEELLETVLNNKKLVKLSSEKEDVFVVFSHSEAQDILLSRYIRARALEEAIKEELPSRASIEALIEERSLNAGDQEAIVELESKVKAQQRLLNMTKIEGRRKPIQETVDKYEKEIRKLQHKNEQLFVLTQEFRADEEAVLYLAWAATYKIDGERYWPSFKDFEASTDLILRNDVIEKFTDFNRGLSVSHIRYLARHVLWRIRYTAALKVGGPLFPRGLHDLTTDQQSLMYWSNYYQSIYEMMPDDQPSDDVIEDDDALNAYMEAYFKEREQERSGGKLKRRSGGKGKLSAEASDEVIVTTNHPDYLQLSYSDKRIKSNTESTEVAVVSPDSRRARNRRAASKNKQG